MKRLNIFDYVDGYKRGIVSSRDIYSRINGKSFDAIAVKSNKKEFGGVLDIMNRCISSTLLVITPAKWIDSTIISSMLVKRSHISNVVGIELVNPLKRIWVISALNVINGINGMAYSQYNNMIMVMSGIDANIVYIYIKYGDHKGQWVSLSDMIKCRDSIAIDSIGGTNMVDVLVNELVILLDILNMHSYILIDLIVLSNEKRKIS
jgi:hypothetical protein